MRKLSAKIIPKLAPKLVPKLKKLKLISLGFCQIFLYLLIGEYFNPITASNPWSNRLLRGLLIITENTRVT